MPSGQGTGSRPAVIIGASLPLHRSPVSPADLLPVPLRYQGDGKHIPNAADNEDRDRLPSPWWLPGYSLHLLQSPLQKCPLFEYCVLETVYSRSVSLIIDLQRTPRFSLLTQAGIQRALDLTYEEIPAGWRNTRALPLLVTRLLENTIDSWSATLQLRMLIVHDEADRWWIEAMAERCRVSRQVYRERITLMNDPQGGFCAPPACILYKHFKPPSAPPVVPPQQL